jgi:hypothetical protein
MLLTPQEQRRRTWTIFWMVLGWIAIGGGPALTVLFGLAKQRTMEQYMLLLIWEALAGISCLITGSALGSLRGRSCQQGCRWHC